MNGLETTRSGWSNEFATFGPGPASNSAAPTPTIVRSRARPDLGALGQATVRNEDMQGVTVQGQAGVDDRNIAVRRPL